MAGFAGRTSGPNIHSLRVVCGYVEGGGLHGSGQATDFAGSSGGTESANLVCGNGAVARGFQLRARSIIHFYRLICGELEVIDAPTSSQNLNGHEVYQHALSNGFTFEASNQSLQDDAACEIFIQRNRVHLEN